MVPSPIRWACQDRVHTLPKKRLADRANWLRAPGARTPVASSALSVEPAADRRDVLVVEMVRERRGGQRAAGPREGGWLREPVFGNPLECGNEAVVGGVVVRHQLGRWTAGVLLVNPVV